MPRKSTTKDHVAEARALIRANAPDVVQNLLDVVRDQKAPAPARATAGTTLLRAGGFFDKIEDGEGKQLHERTAAELDAMIAAAEQRLANLQAGRDEDDNGDDPKNESDVFS